MPDLPHRLRLNGGNVSEKRFVLQARGSIIFYDKNLELLYFAFQILYYDISFRGNTVMNLEIYRAAPYSIAPLNGVLFGS